MTEIATAPLFSYLTCYRANRIDADTIQAAAIAKVFTGHKRTDRETYKTRGGATRAANAVKKKVEDTWGPGSCEVVILRYPGTKPIAPGKCADRFVPVAVPVAVRALENVNAGLVDPIWGCAQSELFMYLGNPPPSLCGRVAWAPLAPHS